MAARVRLRPRCSGGGWCAQPPGQLSPVPPAQAYVEKYKFTSVVAQDLLDSFLSFFPELKEQSVDCRAGEATACHVSRASWPSARGGAAGVRMGGASLLQPRKGPLGSAVPPSANPRRMV